MNILIAPYPFYENSRQGLKICLGIGLFIALFCVFFEPFGLDSVSTMGQIGYGVVSFVVCLLFIVILPMIFPNQLRNEGWTIGREILWILSITFSLGVANYFYSGFVFGAGYGFHLKSFLLVCLYTCLVAIIPAIAIILYKQVFEYKKIIKQAEILDGKLVARGLQTDEQNNGTVLNFNTELKGDALTINMGNFLFLSSSGNYIEVHYLNDGHLKKQLIRNSISGIENDLTQYDKLFRCHRSYLVNLNQVEHLSGNLQGYQLGLKGLDTPIPVSRSYTHKLRALLNKDK